MLVDMLALTSVVKCITFNINSVSLYECLLVDPDFSKFCTCQADILHVT